MEKIRVIYINQTSGLVDASSLDGLVAKGDIVAYCGPKGWVCVRDERQPGPVMDRSDVKNEGTNR